MKINSSNFSIFRKPEKTERFKNMYFHERVTRELQTLYIMRLGGDGFCCIPFSLLRRPHHQNVTLDLGYVLGYFQKKHCESLVKSCFWKSYTMIIIIIIIIIIAIMIIIIIITIMIIKIIIIIKIYLPHSFLKWLFVL